MGSVFRSQAEIDRDKNAAALAKAVVRADHAEAKIGAVRELHKSEWAENPYGVGGLVCSECGIPVESEPCATIRTLNGEA